MKKPNKVITKVFDILSTVIIILLIICVLSNFQTTILGKKYNSFLGYSLFEVETGSMSGTIEIGDWIIVKVTDDVKTNDVITFEQDGAIITHRIVEMYGDTIVTKGDDNNSKDAKPITKENVIGKLVKILPHFSIIKKTLLNEKVLILLFLVIIAANSLFNKEFIDTIKEKLLKIKPENKSNDTSKAEETAIKNLINETPATSETMLLSKVDVDFENNMISNLKDAFDDSDKPLEELTNKNDEPEADSFESGSEFSFNVDVDPSLYPDEEEEQKEDDSPINFDDNYEEHLDEFASFDIDDSKKNKSALIREFIKEADSLDTERADSFDRDIEIISRQLGIQKELEIGKGEKSIVKKTIALKKCQIRRYYSILLDKDENDIEYRSTITKFIDFYIDTMYVKQYLYTNSKAVSEKATDRINYFYHKLFKEAKNDSRRKVINKIYIATNAMLQIELAKGNSTVINKIFASSRLELENQAESRKAFLLEQTRYNEASKLFSKKTTNNKLNIGVEKVKGTELINTELHISIKFSKIFSDYIINKSYNDKVILEDFNEVQIIMISNLINNDMLDFEPRNKYLMTFTPSIYKKPKKLASTLKIVNDEYSQNKILIVVTKDIFEHYLKDIYELKSIGFNFLFEVDKNNIKALNIKNLHLVASYVAIVDPTFNPETDKKAEVTGFKENQILYVPETLVRGIDIK